MRSSRGSGKPLATELALTLTKLCCAGAILHLFAMGGFVRAFRAGADIYPICLFRFGTARLPWLAWGWVFRPKELLSSADKTLAAVVLLCQHFPDLTARVTDITDLMHSRARDGHPHELSGRDPEGLFTADQSVIFAYHGCPWLIHHLPLRPTNHPKAHVHGYKTGQDDYAFRYAHVWQPGRLPPPKFGYVAACAKQEFRRKLIVHQRVVWDWGADRPRLRD